MIKADETKRDSLTGLYQREVIFSYVESLIAQKTPFSYAMLDVDNFKNVNDTYGHHVGDIVLKDIARQLRKTVGDKAVIGRYGGDEFIIVYEGDHDYDDNWQFCFSILRSPEPIRYNDNEEDTIKLSYTMGLARYPFDADDSEQLFDLVDKALYRGKTKGRDCFIIYLEEKHKNIFLKSIRERSYSQMFIHSKLHLLLSSEQDHDEGIRKAIDYVGSYLMLDLLYIQNKDEVEAVYRTPLVVNTTERVEAQAVDEKYIKKFIDAGSTYFVENSLSLSVNKNDPLYKILMENGAFSSVIVEIQAFGRSYGYLRADMIIRGTSRIWQQNELTLLIELAEKIALVKYIEELEKR